MTFLITAITTVITGVKAAAEGIVGLWFFPIAIALAVLSIGISFLASFVGRKRKKKGGR